MADSLVIDPHFNGPPDSGNGGYTCGLLAKSIDGPAVVSLRAPPPLGVPLAVVSDDDGRVRLLDGDALVAEAEPSAPDPAGEPPPFVGLGEARGASGRSRFLDPDFHPFPTCYVCGPKRGEGDGLRIFPGPNGDVYASFWRADPGLADGHGFVPEEIVWAALDCPTSAPGMNEPAADGSLRPIVLARLAVDVRVPVHAGADHVIASWDLGRDGRKREAGAALWDSEGQLLASARALWIELRAR